MIKLIRSGIYQLIQTSKQIKILILEKLTYTWTDNSLSSTKYSLKKKDRVLTTGQYRMYQTKDEAKLTSLLHLELHTGQGVWQGYFLPKGFPKDEKICQIIPTTEIITKPVI